MTDAFKMCFDKMTDAFKTCFDTRHGLSWLLLEGSLTSLNWMICGWWHLERFWTSSMTKRSMAVRGMILMATISPLLLSLTRWTCHQSRRRRTTGIKLSEVGSANFAGPGVKGC